MLVLIVKLNEHLADLNYYSSISEEEVIFLIAKSTQDYKVREEWIFFNL